MNLPAQLAILAGDKRYDTDGRSPLAAHEILNAAGRAGRAGHLANGVVLLIPEPIAAYTVAGDAEPAALGKLAEVLPQNDQCVQMEDPVNALLDRIQGGNVQDLGVRYFVSRVRPTDGTPEAIADAVTTVRRSYAGFRARQNHTDAEFDQKLEALRAVLAAERPAESRSRGDCGIKPISDEPLVEIEARLDGNINALPDSVIGWSSWLVDFLQ